MNTALQQYPKDMQDFVYQYAELNRLAKKVERSLDIQEYDLEKTIQVMLRGKAENTQRAYLASIGIFKSYCIFNGIELIDITATEADEFISYLINREFSNTTVRRHTAAVSSLFAQLVRNRIVPSNPFYNSPMLPEKETNKDYTLMDQEDLDVIIEYYKNITSEKKRNMRDSMLYTITLMGRLGLRVDAFNKLKIEGNKLSTVSKSRKFETRIPDDVLEEISEYEIEKLNSSTIQKNFSRACDKLFAEGEIKKNYTVHCLRHFFAVKKFEETENIYIVQKCLGHKDYRTTQIYLSGLNLIEED